MDCLRKWVEKNERANYRSVLARSERQRAWPQLRPPTATYDSNLESTYMRNIATADYFVSNYFWENEESF